MQQTAHVGIGAQGELARVRVRVSLTLTLTLSLTLTLTQTLTLTLTLALTRYIPAMKNAIIMVIAGVLVQSLLAQILG